MMGYGVIAFQDLKNDRPGCHKVDKFAKKPPRLVLGIEALSLSAGQPDTLLRHDAQAGFFEHCVDCARQIARRGVWLDD
jgi:hypothetical protein